MLAFGVADCNKHDRFIAEEFWKVQPKEVTAL